LFSMSYVFVLTPNFVLIHAQEDVPSIQYLDTFHPDVPENRPARPLPWPEWPAQLGLAISLIGLVGAGSLAFRQRRRPHPA